MIDDEKPRISNRDRVRAPKKRASVYCHGCDGSLLRHGQRCPRCGWKMRAPVRRESPGAR